ncbi:MAG: PilZ domain-containing protein [Pseudomonadota bacterium]
MTAASENNASTDVWTEKSEDRRRYVRVSIPLKARFLAESGEEHPCVVDNISAGGAWLQTKTPPQSDETVVVYVDELGRFEGKVVRADETGFAIAYEQKRSRAKKTADHLTRLINMPRIEVELRNAPRIRQDAPATVYFEDGSQSDCRILDISLIGASIEISAPPSVGANLILGKMAGKIVRHHDTGAAIVFTGPARRTDETLALAADRHPQPLTAPARRRTPMGGAPLAQSPGKKSARA